MRPPLLHGRCRRLNPDGPFAILAKNVRSKAGSGPKRKKGPRHCPVTEARPLRSGGRKKRCGGLRQQVLPLVFAGGAGGLEGAHGDVALVVGAGEADLGRGVPIVDEALLEHRVDAFDL